jgi:branched-chain amino acid transport system permease protein
MIIPPLLMAAIVYACLITILSIGFTLTYLTAKIPNFAHGTYAGIGIYVSYTISKIMGLSPYVGFPLAFLLGGGMSIVIFLLVINVLQRIGGGAIVLTISTLAIQIFLTAALNIYAYWLREVYHTYSMAFMLKEFDFYIGDYPGVFPVTLILCIVTVILLHYMLTRTRIGVAMRATAEDPELASVLGINIYRVQLFSWFLTGGMACLAGAFLPLWFQSSPTTGAAIITSIMAGSLLGGFENVYGAIVGGFGVGFSEILLTYWLQGVFGSWVGEYRPLIPMFFLIAVLLLEPRGLQGVYERLSATKTGERLIGIFSRGRSVS